MSHLTRIARTTGLLYLALGVTGMLGFLWIRSQLHVSDDPGQTLENLTTREGLARLGVALELGIVLTQALVAVWFFRLFRSVSTVAAGAIAAFGLVNAAAILASSAALATAVAVATDHSLAPSGDAAATVHLLYELSGGFWAGGAVFFGLWLIPMGHAVVKSGWMPRALGYILIAGGVGYVISAFTSALAPSLSTVSEIITIPASVGEFWMLGYLIIFGVRRSAISSPVESAS